MLNLRLLQEPYHLKMGREVEDDLFVIDPDLEDNKLRNIIQRLVDDEEVSKLITDERMRCEQHKNNYTKLKTEYSKVFHENKLIQSDLSSLKLNYNDLKDASAKALSEMESEVAHLKYK